MKIFNFLSKDKLGLLLIISVFLFSYTLVSANKQIKFSDDLSLLVGQNTFNSNIDYAYIKGSFNNWDTSIPLLRGSNIVDETTLGDRLFDIKNANKTLPVVKFSLNAVSGLDMTPINNKINVLKVHGLPSSTPSFSNFKYTFTVLTTEEFNVQKPSDVLPFDVGFVASDGTINVSEPTTDAQKAVFSDINKAALYYLCQSYIYFFYQTREMPLLFRVGFPAFESGLTISDATVKTAVNKYGGSFVSFDILNNATTFMANNGLAVGHSFAEFMSVFKNWGYPLVINVTANGFDAAPWWFCTESLKELLADFNRYLNARFLEPDENLRISSFESENFRYYTRAKDKAINFPSFSETVETAYKEYAGLFNVKAFEKLSFFTLPSCVSLGIEGLPCDQNVRLTGGTAWSSGLNSSCASDVSQLPTFVHQNRHELAHAFQGLMPQGSVTAWLNEGFPQFCANGPITSSILSNMRQQGIDALNAGTIYFGHRPTYEDTKVYPSPDFGYYTLGHFLNDFIYRKGGYQALKDVQMGDLDGYKTMGYSSGQAFMDDFYFDFDVRVQNMPVVTLKMPVSDQELTSPQVNISWAPLKADVKLNVLVSTDNKTSWTEVATKTTQTSCIWNAGSFTGKFFLKFLTPDNLSVESVFGPFTVTDLTSLRLNFPNGGEYLIAGDTVKINWGKTNIPNIKLEYSDNNGTNWSQVSANTVASPLTYKWVVPNIASAQCKIRISDVANAAKTDGSDKVFTILKSNEVGGPYLYDKNTILLLHFDNDLNNRSYYSGNANGSIDNLVSDPTVNSLMGNCLKTSSPVTVPHTSNLNLTGDWTIEAWVKPVTINANANNYIVTKQGDVDAYEANYSLEINPWWNNVFHGFYFSGANSRISQRSFSPSLNEWMHVAFIRDTKNSEIRMIVHDKNRKEISNISTKYTAAETLLNTRDLIVGSGIDGYIDELRISNVVRSFIVTGTNELTAVGTLAVFPNPTDGIVHLKWNNLLIGAIEAIVTDMRGQTVYTNLFPNDGSATLNLSNFPKGIYFIQLRNNMQVVTQKIVLE